MIDCTIYANIRFLIDRYDIIDEINAALKDRGYQQLSDLEESSLHRHLGAFRAMALQIATNRIEDSMKESAQ